MRIVTWNMNAAFRGEGHPAGWAWLAETLRPDLVLAQEAIKPDHLAGHGSLIGAAGSCDGWGTWVTTLNESVDVEPVPQHQRAALADLSKLAAPSAP